MARGRKAKVYARALKPETVEAVVDRFGAAFAAQAEADALMRSAGIYAGSCGVKAPLMVSVMRQSLQTGARREAAERRAEETAELRQLYLDGLADTPLEQAIERARIAKAAAAAPATPEPVKPAPGRAKAPGQVVLRSRRRAPAAAGAPA